MKMLFETVENEDFFEIILNEEEIEIISEKGVVKDFPFGLYGKRNLNVYVRKAHEGEEDAIEEGEGSENEERIF